MHHVSPRTRLKAFLLRTFRGRRPGAGEWEDMPAATARGGVPASSGGADTFTLGELVIDVVPHGLRATGANPPSVVYEVRVTRPGDSRRWSSRYGLPPTENSAAAAAEIALDDLDQAWRDPEGWTRAATGGLTEDEAEAILDSRAVRLDLKSAQWVGPLLDAVRPGTRDATGRWIGS